MVLYECPNRRCLTQYGFTVGFRPMRFMCPGCGLNGVWFADYEVDGGKIQKHGYIKWEVTPFAMMLIAIRAIIESLLTGVSDPVSEVIEIEAKIEKYIAELVEDVANAQKERPLASTNSGDSAADFITARIGDMIHDWLTPQPD